MPFPSPELSIPFIRGPATEDAWRQLDSWFGELKDIREAKGGEPRGPAVGLPVVALTGGEGAGKTRLLQQWLAQYGGIFITSSSPDAEAQKAPVAAIDEADSWSALELFAEVNEAMSTGRPLILTGTQRPVKWVTDPSAPGAPDLLSRLHALQMIELDAPDEETMAKALKQALFTLGLDLSESAVKAAAGRLCRRFTAVRDVALSAARLSPSIAAAKPLLEAAITDNPRHCLST